MDNTPLRYTIEDGETVYLVMVSAEKNSNKYYKIERVGDSLVCTYGRVQESNSASKTYPKTKFASLYKSKRKKGYVDQTDLFRTEQVETKIETPSLVFSEQEVSDFVALLKRNARDTAQRSLSVNVDSVTPMQIDESTKKLTLISDAVNKGNIDEANELMQEQFAIIPRFIDRRSGVAALMFNDDKKRNDSLLEKEYELLDQLKTIAKEPTKIEEKIEVPFEISLSKITDDLAKQFYQGLVDQYTSAKIVNVFEVHNLEAESAFNDIGNIESLWHGSKTANWMSILTNNLIVRPPGIPTTGSMFGNGIYFATKAQKSLGYSSMQGSYWTSGGDTHGVLALYSVSLGNVDDVNNRPTYDAYIETSVKKGFNSLWVRDRNTNPKSSLYNEEVIIPNGNQCKPSHVFMVRHK
jgi:poly [ADP-ribose] polymerase